MTAPEIKQLSLKKAGSAGPKYLNLKSQLLEELSSGRLKSGDALPSEQQLAVQMGVARMTVRQALAELEHDGFVRRVQGSGTFVEEGVQQRLDRSVSGLMLVVPQTRGGFYPSLIHGFEVGCMKAHCPLWLSNTSNDLGRQADVLLQLMDRRPSGLAIVPATDPATPSYQIRQIQRQGIPVVFCHRRVEGIDAPLVTFSFEEIGRVAGRALVEFGHRQVGFVTAGPGPLFRRYSDTLRATMQANGGDLLEENIFVRSAAAYPHTAEDEQAVTVALRSMLQGPNRPTAIMASFDTMGEVALNALVNLGVRVPEDVSLIGWGGTWRDGLFLRRLTSVVVDEEKIGQLAAEVLHQMHVGERPLLDKEEFILDLSLYRGETLGPVNTSPRSIGS